MRESLALAMTVRRLSAMDAQTYWLSAKIPMTPSCCMASPACQPTLNRHSSRSLSVPRLPRPDGAHRRWGSFHVSRVVHRDVDRSLFVVHGLEGGTWAECLAHVSVVTADQLDARVAAWRLHVFTDVEGVPGAAGPGTVAVLQISHALGGGGRTSTPAAIMFGRLGGVIPGIDAALMDFSHCRSWVSCSPSAPPDVEDTDAGRVPPPADLRPALRTNARQWPRHLRTVVRTRSDLSGPTVTVAALSAVSVALAETLLALGDDPSSLGAECRWPSRRHAWRTTIRERRSRSLSGARRAGTHRADRCRPRRAAPSGRTPCDAHGRPGLRGDAGAVVALGHGPIRSRCPRCAGDG